MATATKGTLVWAADDPAVNREALKTAAAELQLAVAFCPYADLADRLLAGGAGVAAVELGADPGRALRLIGELHEHMPAVAIFAASADGGITTVRSALEAGAADCLSLPVNPQELQKALLKATRGAAKNGTGNGVAGEVITVCGARGGLGVTTLAVNLAVQLASLAGQEVALVDLDLQRGDVAAFLNLTPHQTLAAIAGARGEVDQIFLHTAMTRHASGVFVLPAPMQIEESDLVGHEDVALCLRLLRSRFRYTVIDTARTISAATIAAYEQADRVLLLTDLSVPGVRAARRLLELLNGLERVSRRVDVLVSRIFPGPVSIRDAARAIGEELCLTIPRDETAASTAMNGGVPLNGRQSPLQRAVGQLAAKLAGLPAEPAAARGQFLRRILNLNGET